LTQKKGTGPVPLSLQLEELVAFQEVNDTGQGNPWQSLAIKSPNEVTTNWVY